MKKILSVLLVVVIVFNFIALNYIFADQDDVSRSTERYSGNGTVSNEAAKTVAESGTDTSGNSYEHTNYGGSMLGVLLQSVAAILNIFPYTIQTALGIFTANPDGPDGNTFKSIVLSTIGEPDYHFSIERTVFNEISVLNINIFNQEKSYTVGSGSHTKTIYQNKILLDLKESVAGWFYTIRLLAMMINLCVLIYVGIRMATSSIASEEAKYKKMLMGWLESMVVLFLLHYIMYVIMFVGDFFLNIIDGLRWSAIDNENAISFEQKIIEKVYSSLIFTGGMAYAGYSILFWFLTALQIKFFFSYFKRMLTIFFLVVISPLITVTYPIDKIGDGKAQAYERWLQEFTINVIIQPIHAVSYLVFAYTAGKIAETAPIAAMIFLLALGRVENIIRNVFKINGSVKNVNDARKGHKRKGGIPFMNFIGKGKE